MNVDPRLDEIDDCLYRVAVRAVVVKDNKVLLVKEIPEMWWGFPGGGVDHGEGSAAALTRELEEELGITQDNIETNFSMIHHSIGAVIDGIPRMNLFYRVTLLPRAQLTTSEEVAEWSWFTKEEFMRLEMSPSYSEREELADVIFHTARVSVSRK